MDRKLYSSISSKKNAYLGSSIYNPRYSFNISSIINEFSYSNDDNTRCMGLFLHKLINEYGVELPVDMIKIIKSNIRINNNNYIYRNSNMNYVKALSNSCLVADLLENRDLKVLGFGVLNKILNGKISTDEEYYAYISALSLRVKDIDQEKLKDVIDAYKKVYSLNGDREVILDNLRKMLILIDLNDLKFKKTILGAFYSIKENVVYLNDAINDDYTVFHEFGHAMDDFFNDRKHDGREYEPLYKKARSHARDNRKFKKILKKLDSTMSIVYDEARRIFDSRMIRIHGSKDAIYRAYRIMVSRYINENGIEELLDTFGIDDETTAKVLLQYDKGKLDLDKLAKIVYDTQKENQAEKVWRARPEGCVSDIISSVFKSINIKVNGEEFLLFNGHDNDYYYSYDDAPMCELMANYNLLKVMGLNREIQMLREIFGDVFVNTLESIYYSNSSNTRRFRNIDMFEEDEYDYDDNRRRKR